MRTVENLSQRPQKLGNLARTLEPGETAEFTEKKFASYGPGWARGLTKMADQGLLKLSKKKGSGSGAAAPPAPTPPGTGKSKRNKDADASKVESTANEQQS